MHWSRWGDPAQAGPLSDSAFALVDAFIGTTETPAVERASVRLSAAAPTSWPRNRPKWLFSRLISPRRCPTLKSTR